MRAFPVSRQETLSGRAACALIVVPVLRPRRALLRHGDLGRARQTGPERLRRFHHVAEAVPPQADEETPIVRTIAT